MSHLDRNGLARMVDVSGKPVTRRVARAEASLRVAPTTLVAIRRGRVSKGDVFALARTAGILAAKRVGELIPLCHHVPLDYVSLDVGGEGRERIRITATAAATGRTGVEMEALTAASVAALTVYDMCKSIERGITIERIQLVAKSGGRSGAWLRRG